MAILTRLQIARAIYGGLYDTQDYLVYKEWDGNYQMSPTGVSSTDSILPSSDTGLRGTTTTDTDSDAPLTYHEREKALLLELGAGASPRLGGNPALCDLGATIGDVKRVWDSAANGNFLAKIGDKNSSRREEWYYQFLDIKDLINNQFLGGNPDAVNPGAWLEDINYLTPEMYTYMDMDGDGYNDDVIYSGPERSTDTVKKVIQDELQRFRSSVYAPNSAGSGDRQLYFDMAYASTIARARYLGPLTPVAMQTKQYFLDLERKLATRPLPKAFTLNNTADTYEKRVKWVGTRFIVRLYAMHNALYGSDLLPFKFGSSVVKVQANPTVVRYIIANIQAALEIIAIDQQTWIDDEPLRDALRGDVQEDLTATKLEDTGFTIERLPRSAIASISQNVAYKELFSTTFNQGLLTAVPMIQSLYLTSLHFPDLNDVFLGPKREALNLLLQTIEGDTGFPDEPDLSRPASAAAIANANGMPPEEFGLNAGKFILKMLIQTPISILKGLTELIDPHVAITKVIKIATSQGFNAAAEALKPAATAINTSLEEAEIVEKGTATGKDLMTLILCLVDYAFEQGDAGIQSVLPPDAPPLPGNFFPDVSMRGVDFTGTVSGMLMVPPSPLGLVYLLLELVKSAIDDITVNVDDAAAENAEENAC